MKQVRIPTFRREEKCDLLLFFGPPRFFPELGPLGGRREVGPGIPGGFFPANRSASVPRRGHSFFQWPSPSQIVHLPRRPGRESPIARDSCYFRDSFHARDSDSDRSWSAVSPERCSPCHSSSFFPWIREIHSAILYDLSSSIPWSVPEFHAPLNGSRTYVLSSHRPLEPSSFFTAFPSGSNPLCF